MTPKLRTLLVLVATLLPLDFFSKRWIAANVSRYEPIEVIEGFFRITHAENPGMAFGLFQNVHISVFILLSFLALGLMISIYRGVPAHDRLGATALGLILAGALGNLIDRVFWGRVVDFLQFDFGVFIFPDFNVADSCIVIGTGLFLFELVASETEEAAEEEEGGS